MLNTKIDWANSTWNPVTGCFHKCAYCYARKIAQRYGLQPNERLCMKDGKNLLEGRDYTVTAQGKCMLYVLNVPAYAFHYDEEGVFTQRPCPYPFGFAPTFHRYRLDEYAKKMRPRDIFVCSMADLFGEWVPDEWIQEVFQACRRGSQHRYLFLTKNTERYHGLDGWPENAWAGFSATDQEDLEAAALDSQWMPKQSFLSIEPIHGHVDLAKVEVRGRGAFINMLNGGRYWLMGGDQAGVKLKWVIVGAETGNRVGKIIPERDWVLRLADQCQEAGVSLWMKESLRGLIGKDFLQDKPWWNG